MASLVITAVFEHDGKSTRVRSLLDTGAEMTLLSSVHSKKIGLKDLGAIGIRGAGGRASLRLSKIGSITVPGTKCESGPMPLVIFDERAFPLGGLTGLGAIIGLDYMQRVRMRIMAFKESSIIQCGV